MALDAFKNFAKATLSAGITSAASTLTVTTGQGARFPTVPFNATICEDGLSAADEFNAGRAEIVRVTNIATDTFTITRAQESTTARDFNTGGKTYQIFQGLTQKTVATDIFSSVAGTANEITATPATGAVTLSLPTALTFTGKTVTGGTFNSGAFNGTVGATTPSTGSFTTLAASSTVSGTGFSTYLASPPAIGGTAAAAGTFTSLTATSTIIAPAATTSISSIRLPHGTAPSSPTNGDMWTTSAGGLYVHINGVTVGPLGASVAGSDGEKSVMVTYPTTGDTKIILGFSTAGLTVSKIVAVLPGGTSTPSVTFNIRHGSDVSAAGTAVVTGGSTTTNISTGTSITSFNNATISANSFIWLEVTAVSGTVPALSVTVEF